MDSHRYFIRHSSQGCGVSRRLALGALTAVTHAERGGAVSRVWCAVNECADCDCTLCRLQTPRSQSQIGAQSA